MLKSQVEIVQRHSLLRSHGSHDLGDNTIHIRLLSAELLADLHAFFFGVLSIYVCSRLVSIIVSNRI